MADLKRVSDLISSDDVVLFMKGTPDFLNVDSLLMLLEY